MENQYVAIFSMLTFVAAHTSMPSHWLCFVAVGKAQGWRRRHVLAVAAFAGTIHVLTMIGLGILTQRVGEKLFDHEALERVSAFVLMGLGALYLGLHFFGAGHHHESDRRVPDRWAVGSLVLAVTISPCSAAIPVLVAAAGQGVTGMLLVSAVLFIATLGNMMLLVTLGSLALERLQFRLFDRYEKLILGVVIEALGVAMLLFGHAH